jgi:hypothetical protein
MIINDNSRVINKLETSPTDDARVVIYDRHMFRVEATDLKMIVRCVMNVPPVVHDEIESRRNVNSDETHGSELCGLYY